MALNSPDENIPPSPPVPSHLNPPLPHFKNTIWLIIGLLMTKFILSIGFGFLKSLGLHFINQYITTPLPASPLTSATDNANINANAFTSTAIEVLIAIATDLNLSQAQINYYRNALSQSVTNINSPQAVVHLSGCLKRLSDIYHNPVDAFELEDYRIRLFHDILTQCLPSNTPILPVVEIITPQPSNKINYYIFMAILLFASGVIGKSIWVNPWFKISQIRITKQTIDNICILIGLLFIWILTALKKTVVYYYDQRDFAHKLKSNFQNYCLTLWSIQNQPDTVNTPEITKMGSSKESSKGSSRNISPKVSTASRNQSRERYPTWAQAHKYGTSTVATANPSTNSAANKSDSLNITKIDINRTTPQTCKPSNSLYRTGSFNRGSYKHLPTSTKKLMVQLGQNQFDLNTHEGREKWIQHAQQPSRSQPQEAAKLPSSSLALGNLNPNGEEEKEEEEELTVIKKDIINENQIIIPEKKLCLPLKVQTQISSSGSNIILEHGPCPVPLSVSIQENNNNGDENKIIKNLHTDNTNDDDVIRKSFKPKLRNLFDSLEKAKSPEKAKSLEKTKCSEKAKIQAVAQNTTTFTPPKKRVPDERWWKADKGIMASTASGYNPFTPYGYESIAPLKTSTPLHDQSRSSSPPVQPVQPRSSCPLPGSMNLSITPPRKPYRRIFIPGRGWISAKRLAQEMDKNIPVV